MTARIRPRRPDELDEDQRRLYDTIAHGPRSQGPQHFALTAPDESLRGPFDGFLLSPAVGSALQELGAAIRYRTALTDRTRELAILLVAARWGCAFEQEAHEPIARAAGLSVDEIAAARSGDVAWWPPDGGVVARTVTGLLDGDLDDAAWDAAAAELGADAVFELTALVGYYSTLALQLRVFRVGR